MIIKAVVGGEEREFEVLVRGNPLRTHALTAVSISEVELGGFSGTPLRLIRKQHQFGPITYEETGEVKSRVEAGEYYLSPIYGGLVAKTSATTLVGKVTIVKPLI